MLAEVTDNIYTINKQSINIYASYLLSEGRRARENRSGWFLFTQSVKAVTERDCAKKVRSRTVIGRCTTKRECGHAPDHNPAQYLSAEMKIIRCILILCPSLLRKGIFLLIHFLCNLNE